MSEDGKVVYKVVADDSGLDQQLDQTGKSIEKKTSSWGKFADKALKAVGTAAIGASAAVIKYGSDFEQSLANASTLIDTNVTDMTALQEKILALSDSSGIAASELNNSLYSALSAGIPATEDMSEAMSFLESATKLAKAGFTDMDTAVSATAKVLNAYGMDVSEVDRVHKVLMQTQNLGITTVDQLGSTLAQVTPTAAAMGVSFEQVGAALATMTAKGTETSTATAQLNQLLAELGKGGTDASDLLRAKTGKSFQELTASGQNLSEILKTLVSATGDTAEQISSMMEETNSLTGELYTYEEACSALGVDTETLEANLIDMFGSLEAGKAALSIAGDETGKFADNLSAMSTEVDVVGEAYDKVTETSAAKFNEMLNQLINTAIRLFNTLQPVVMDVLPVLSNLLESLLPPLVDLVSSLLPPLTELLDALLPPVLELIDMILPPLIEFLETLLPPLTSLLETLLPPLLEILEILLEPLFTLLEAVLPVLIGLIEQLSPLLEMLTPLFQSLAEIIAGDLQGAFDIILPVINSFWNLLDGLIDFVTGVFTLNWDKAWQGIVKIVKSWINLIPTAVETVINSLIEMINGLIRGVNSASKLIGITIPTIPHVTLPRLQTGIDYVMEDWTPAYLDRGERVLTAAENLKYTAAGGIDGMERAISNDVGTTAINTDGIMEMLAGIRADIQAGKVLTVDRQTFAQLVAKANRSQARATGWNISL